MFALGVFLPGCGDAPDGSGNRLVVSGIRPEAGKEGFVFPAVDLTNDEGCDGDPLVFDGDGTQNNRWPDVITNPACLESLVRSLDNPEHGMGFDLVDIDLRNENNPGVAEGRPFEVRAIQITYRDAAGNTPLYAPQRTFDWPAEVPAGETVTLVNVPLTTQQMKIGSRGVTGLRDLFFDPAQGPIELVAHITFFCEDTLNNDRFSVTRSVTMTFVNPNPSLD
jgi:hypothetical protein